MSEGHSLIKRQEPTEADVLAAVDPSDHAGTPTYVIRNRLLRGDLPLNVADVRRVLGRLERQGWVHRTARTRANQVHWKVGRKLLSGQNVSLALLQGQSANGAGTEVER